MESTRFYYPKSPGETTKKAMRVNSLVRDTPSGPVFSIPIKYDQTTSEGIGVMEHTRFY